MKVIGKSLRNPRLCDEGSSLLVKTFRPLRAAPGLAGLFEVFDQLDDLSSHIFGMKSEGQEPPCILSLDLEMEMGKFVDDDQVNRSAGRNE